jgi:divalent metal cation (Fe/Co/Zn/Cd) transporter
MFVSDEPSRTAYVRTGRTLELLTILWNSLEAVIAVVAGFVAGSIALVGFGLDSLSKSLLVLLCYGASRSMPKPNVVRGWKRPR